MDVLVLSWRDLRLQILVLELVLLFHQCLFSHYLFLCMMPADGNCLGIIMSYRLISLTSLSQMTAPVLLLEIQDAEDGYNIQSNG